VGVIHGFIRERGWVLKILSPGENQFGIGQARVFRSSVRFELVNF
jgi:hypothetical protein